MKKTSQSFLYLPLNEISYSAEKYWTTPDLGTGNQAPQVFGNPEFIHDPELGTCIKLDGIDDYIELPSLQSISKSKGITIAAWVRLDKDAGWCTILAMNAKPPKGTDHSFATVMEGATCLLINSKGRLYFGAPEPELMMQKKLIAEACTWFHIAITFAPSGTDSSKGNMTVFINGKPVHNEQWAYYAAGVSDDSGQFFCGKPDFFKGCMAHLRVEESALTEKEIINRMQTDRNEMTRYRSVYPLNFDLYSVYQEDQVKVMYLESPGKGEPLELAISNTTQNAMAFAKFSENVDKTHYHIQLRFRKNVIAPAVLAALRAKEIALDGVSEYVVSEVHDSAREDWISLKWEKKQALKGGQTDVISIPNFSAASRGGARNTRIEVRFANLQLGSAKDTKIDGSVIRHMEIQSHLGLKTLPLYPTIVGSNTILNDGETPNELVIQIRNTNPDRPISFNNKADHPEAPSRFELVVRSDLFEKKYKGKKTGERVMEASTTSDGIAKHRENGANDLVNQFTIVDNSIRNLSNDSISLCLENWVSKAATGAHYFILRYKNIPGYQDGEWIVPVLMGPIVVRNVDDETRVGIGTDIPKAKLHVKGNILIDSESGDKTPETQADLHVRGLVEIEASADENRDDPKFALNVKGDAKFSDKLDSANITVSKTLRFGDPTKHKEPNEETKAYDETYIKQALSHKKHNSELHISAKSKGKLIINDIASNKIDQELMSWDTSEVLVSQELTVKGNIKSSGRIEDQTGPVMPVGSIIAYAGNIREWKDYNEKMDVYNRSSSKYYFRMKYIKPSEPAPIPPIPPADAPKGWLSCNGQAIYESKYPLLYAAVGEKTPDLRGKLIVGAYYNEQINEGVIGIGNTVQANKNRLTYDVLTYIIKC